MNSDFGIPDWLQILILIAVEIGLVVLVIFAIQSRIADRVRRSVNAQAISWLNPFERALPKERYVLYTLHHQPEASIDVFGSLNSNQASLIDSVSRLLPATHKLWVKEHKGAIGDRSLAWLRRIKKLPNVRLVDPFEDVLTLIRNADLVVTVSGTAGEFQDQTQVSATSVTRCGTGTVTPVDVTLPLSPSDALEPFEGMLVRLPCLDVGPDQCRRCRHRGNQFERGAPRYRLHDGITSSICNPEVRNPKSNLQFAFCNLQLSRAFPGSSALRCTRTCASPGRESSTCSSCARGRRTARRRPRTCFARHAPGNAHSTPTCSDRSPSSSCPPRG